MFSLKVHAFYKTFEYLVYEISTIQFINVIGDHGLLMGAYL